ncbi:hypothetical protein NHQ30_003122 [Ciborinia camelliae]|nr:hypothetical protein NHQ30_003122 [Ciborinia camelliae]
MYPVQQFYDFAETSILQRRREEENFKNTESKIGNSRKDIFHYLINATDNAGHQALSIEEFIAEAYLLIPAGTDTTATTIVGLWFYIVRYPRVYAKLVEEIRTEFASADDIRMGPTLSSCKYLTACIEEALRLAPVGPAELP